MMPKCDIGGRRFKCSIYLVTYFLMAPNIFHLMYQKKFDRCIIFLSLSQVFFLLTSTLSKDRLMI